MNGRKAPASLPRTIIAMPGQGADLGKKKAHDISQLWYHHHLGEILSSY